MSHGTGLPILPNGAPQLERWRVCLVAYRDAAQAGHYDQECSRAGVNALLQTHPEMTEAQAIQEMVDSVGWVTRSEHSAWFYAGRPPRPAYIWPPIDGDFGYYRRPGSKRP